MRQLETVRLADGDAAQTLIDGVRPVSPTERTIAALQRARAARRGFAPVGGLFSETERKQQELF